MTSKSIYWIISGNYNEFISHMKNVTSNHSYRMNEYEYRYVSEPNILRGIAEIHGSFIGTWYNREDATEIYAVIRSSHLQASNATIYSMNKAKQILLEYHNK